MELSSASAGVLCSCSPALDSRVMMDERCGDIAFKAEIDAVAESL